MGKFCLYLGLFLIFPGCSDSSPEGNKVKATSKSETSSADTNNGIAPPYAGSSADRETPQQGGAIAPVPVGGASLTCQESPDAKSLDCRTTDSLGQPVAFPAVEAYIIQGFPLAWISVQLHPDDLNRGFWTLDDLPVLSDDFRVVLTNKKQMVVSDQITDAPTAASLIKDGSFEERRVSVVDGALDATSEFLLTGSEDPWQALSSRSCAGVLEMKAALYDGEAKDGTQWIELDSRCKGPSDERSGGDNPVISQNISLERDHWYLIRFSYRNHLPNISQGFRSKLGSKVLVETKVTAENWTELKFAVKAKTEKSVLQFQEIGPIDGIGTWIDDVGIEDLGKGPSNGENLPTNANSDAADTETQTEAPTENPNQTGDPSSGNEGKERERENDGRSDNRGSNR